MKACGYGIQAQVHGRNGLSGLSRSINLSVMLYISIKYSKDIREVRKLFYMKSLIISSLKMKYSICCLLKYQLE